MAPLKEKVAEGKANLIKFLMLFHPTTIKEMIATAKTMTPIEIILVILTTMFWTTYEFGSIILRVTSFSYSILISLMRGSDDTAAKKSAEEPKQKKAPIGSFKTTFFYILEHKTNRFIFQYLYGDFYTILLINVLAIPEGDGEGGGDEGGDLLAIEDQTER